ncbi:2-hydroxyisoflavanone dehydratase-like [Cornus florida]|uniref:2-hydroxyisoflavanone dehydratase-like n=1 Tax=Cornus florida TaxID=4283 RepID=UPI0028A01822|nr:2-hydroxyisoflavanone dehydratase-like [Cornus florida]
MVAFGPALAGQKWHLVMIIPCVHFNRYIEGDLYTTTHNLSLHSSITQFSFIFIHCHGIQHQGVATELLPVIRVFKDGAVERLFGSPYVPPSPQDPATGVSSKDITISPNVSARLFLPNLTQPTTNQKLPILVYFHGGAFCLESAFSLLDHNYLNAIVSEAKAVAVSVEYRLAPEHPLPAAYEDCWEALQWVASHAQRETGPDNYEPWLTNHGDFSKVFIGGDSAGGNIVHNVAMRAGVEGLHGDIRILGGFLSHPYFWGSEPVGSEPSGSGHEESLAYRVWPFVYPSAPGGIDSPMINPMKEGAPSLSGLGCSRLLVCVAEKDELRERGVCYYDAVKESGWRGNIELFEVKGEDHTFHVFNLATENAINMIERLASFLVQ